MARSCWLARRHAHAIWVKNSNGTNGRVGVQNSSLSKLLRWDWNLEKSIATGTHSSEPFDHLERRTAITMDWRKRHMRIAPEAQVIFCRRRHQPRRPPLQLVIAVPKAEAC